MNGPSQHGWILGRRTQKVACSSHKNSEPNTRRLRNWRDTTQLARSSFLDPVPGTSPRTKSRQARLQCPRQKQPRWQLAVEYSCARNKWAPGTRFEPNACLTVPESMRATLRGWIDAAHGMRPRTGRPEVDRNRNGKQHNRPRDCEKHCEANSTPHSLSLAPSACPRAHIKNTIE